METNGYPCPCCGHPTRSEEDYGTFDICPVCNWEDDAFQVEQPTEWGANRVSLIEARRNFKTFGTIESKLSEEAESSASQPDVQGVTRSNKAAFDLNNNTVSDINEVGETETARSVEVRPATPAKEPK
ncbi:cysteine-rich CPCC-domain-containing protein [Jimgerdemannia flammicorona]|uniref:Cysteine-rich CPCC-domain-containing protein n=1 Tax=Jimgerdemannia flammicorona TaxID=994334 RepID=A0A433DH09_9FUNG|nr:cysteine-rich CPCC-domain-containing protein [Jimgerdemannia flammicorona]